MIKTTSEMKGKVCMVTGATSGIGRETARDLASRGAHVVVIGRNHERGMQTIEAIVNETGNNSIEFMQADLSSQKQVRRLAQEFLFKHEKLDVLVNNCGAFFAVRKTSDDGIEMTLALNHLGPFLLTNLLLDVIKTAAPSRIVNVSSSAHEDVKEFDIADPQAMHKSGIAKYPSSEFASLFYVLIPWAHPGLLQYAHTKLANLLFTKEMARRLNGTGVTANALHPGIVASNFSGGNGVYGWFMRRFLSMRGISVERGAETVIYVATSPEVVDVSGQYFINNQIAICSEAARDSLAATKLWQLSEELVKTSTNISKA